MELGLAARRHDAIGHGLAVVDDVGDDDPVAGLAESQGGGAADADAATGDENRLHGIPHSITSPEFGPSV